MRSKPETDPSRESRKETVGFAVPGPAISLSAFHFSDRHSTVNQVDLAGRECGLVRGKINGKSRDLRWFAQSAHRLSSDERLADVLLQ